MRRMRTKGTRETKTTITKEETTTKNQHR
jgi:hypothetical protein